MQNSALRNNSGASLFHMIRIIGSAVLIGLISGCASIIDGTSQPLSVTTPPTQGATCSLKNSKGVWYVNATPGSTTVHRAYGDLIVNCKKPGWNGAVKTVSSSTKGMAFANILVGGIIGAGVDMHDGAAYDYPTSIVVPMKKKVTTKQSSVARHVSDVR